MRDLLAYKAGNILAAQGILTYCANRTLTYHLYADGSGLLVLAASLTSVRLAKYFLSDEIARFAGRFFTLLGKSYTFVLDKSYSQL